MTRLLSIRAITTAILVAVGLLLACLPEDWIEQRLGVDPDGGNGFVELLSVATFIVIGMTLAVGVFVSYRRPRSSSFP